VAVGWVRAADSGLLLDLRRAGLGAGDSSVSGAGGGEVNAACSDGPRARVERRRRLGASAISSPSALVGASGVVREVGAVSSVRAFLRVATGLVFGVLKSP
jgi:hypothetical protein